MKNNITNGSIIPVAIEESLIARYVRTIDPKLKGPGRYRGDTAASEDILAAMPLESTVADSIDIQ